MSIIETANEMFSGILDVLYPPHCLICGVEERETYCLNCRKEISPLNPPFCEMCGLPSAEGKRVCRSCETAPPPYDSVIVLGRYEGGLKRAIHLLKYEGNSALAKPLGRLLAETIFSKVGIQGSFSDANQEINCKDEAKHAFDCIVPVPLHPSRQRERGFNQSLLLAEPIADRFACEINLSDLKRVRKTRIQATLNQLQRTGNVRGAFETSSALSFNQRKVLLVDDVMTTASTLRECAKVLKNAGAASVWVAVLARGD